MDANRITQKIYAGYEKAAKRLGKEFTVYRVTDPLDVLGNSVGTVLASFNAQDWGYTRPNLPGKPWWYTVVDGRVLEVGDILVGTTTSETYVIAGMQTHLPILSYDCNTTLDVSRQDLDNHTSSALLKVVAACPASVINTSVGGGRQDYEHATGQGHYRVLMPYLGVNIHTNDVATNALGDAFLVQSVEHSDYGWRLLIEKIAA